MSYRQSQLESMTYAGRIVVTRTTWLRYAAFSLDVEPKVHHIALA